MKISRLALTVCLASLMASCVTLQSVSLTQVPKVKKNKIEASDDKLIFFGLNFDNKHVDAVKDSLARQCKGGLLTGVLTKVENHLYLGALLYKNKVSATGYCLK